MLEHGARERRRALDVREMGRALEDVKSSVWSPRRDELRMLDRRGGVVRSPRRRAWARRSRRVGPARPRSRRPRSSARTPRAASWPAAPESAPPSSDPRAENSGVNHRPTTVSAIAAIPSVRTVLARSAQTSGGPRYADVQARTSRSTRSGATSASAIPTIPPSETPQSETRSSPSSSRSSSRPCANASTVHGGSGSTDAPWPGWSYVRTRKRSVSSGSCRLHSSCVVPSEFDSTRAGASPGPRTL